jgi:hypothetical protein
MFKGLEDNIAVFRTVAVPAKGSEGNGVSSVIGQIEAALE